MATPFQYLPEQKNPEQKQGERKQPRKKMIPPKKKTPKNIVKPNVIRGVRQTVPIAKSAGVPTDGEVVRRVVTPLTAFVNMDRVLYQGADEIPGMTEGLRYALEKSGYEFVSQMFSEFIKRIGTIEKDTDVINMYTNWLRKIYITCDYTDPAVQISNETYAGVTESMRVLAEEKGLIVSL